MSETGGGVGPDFSLERELDADGFVAGIDEAGRGPLAGPVVAAAVILDPEAIPEGIQDSKKLSHAERESLFGRILSSACVGWCSVDAETIDRINILQATLSAMSKAFQSLPTKPRAALIDGRDVPVPLRGMARSVIRGDSRSLSVAAASIVAKCVRDRIMEKADQLHPGYGFARHRGYPTAFHLGALERMGPCRLHRKSFAPVARSRGRGGAEAT